MPTIKTKKFTLRPYKLTDAEAIAKNINNRKIYRYTLSIPYPYALSDARSFLKRNLPANKKGEKLSLAIVINREIVGCVSFENIEKNHKAELGYWLAEPYWGRGIASQAVKLITDYGFNKLKLRRIYAYVFIKNLASQRVLIKNGFKKEGLQKKNVIKDGKFMDDIVFAKVR